MNDGNEKETEDLEICSEEHSPVSDNCMVEEVLALGVMVLLKLIHVLTKVGVHLQMVHL